MTGDDHGNGGTAGPLRLAGRAEPARLLRGGLGVHPQHVLRLHQHAADRTRRRLRTTRRASRSGCTSTRTARDWTPAQLESFYSTQLAGWQAKYASLPSPVTNRTHCISWSDWASQPKVELAHGIRFDTNYYYWPPDWIQNRPGLFTGSGMPMRFADLDGTVIDVYQARDADDRRVGPDLPVHRQHAARQSTGPDGYYGAFIANMHTDSASSAGAAAIVNSAHRARRAGRVLAADADVARRAQRVVLRLARPTAAARCRSRSRRARARTACERWFRRRRPTVPITASRAAARRCRSRSKTVKGIEYARFDAAAGSYEATYVADTTGRSSPTCRPIRTPTAPPS